MNIETREGIRIADKHLAGASAERRKALALDIADAILAHAGNIAATVIHQAVAKLDVPEASTPETH